MVSPHRIKYAGISSDELNILNLIMCAALDSDSGETNSFLNRSAVQSESHDGRYKPTARYKYDEVFAPKFTFLKKDFSDFSMEEVRLLLKYLTSKDTTALLEVFYDDSEAVTWAAIGGWTEINLQKLANNRTIGVTAVFSAVHPFALSDVYTITKDVTKQIESTVYDWAATTISGNTVPQHLLTNTSNIEIGTKLYAVYQTITDDIIDIPMTLYGTISSVNADGSYNIGETVIELVENGTKIKRAYDNKIMLEIDTDDNKAVCPRVTIQEKGSVVKIPTGKTFDNILDMADCIENTVYHNGSKFYWKTPEAIWRSDSTKPAYKEWNVVKVDRAYTEEDTYVNNTFYYYVDGDMYYWVDPYSFHSSDRNPNLSTTSVKFINTHIDFFHQSNVLNSTIIKNNNTFEIITLDGTNKIVSSNSTNRIFGNDFNWQWLELYDGENEITVEGNCTVTLEWREVRKVGEY